MGKPVMPRGLQDRGRKMWRDTVTDDMATSTAILLAEACRTADRLEELDKIIRGEHGVSELMKIEFDPEDLEAGAVEVNVVFDNVMMEARQQQASLRQALGTLNTLTKATTKADKPARSKPAGGTTGPQGVVGGRTGWRGA